VNDHDKGATTLFDGASSSTTRTVFNYPVAASIPLRQIDRSFFNRSPLLVAPELLGKLLVKEEAKRDGATRKLVGRIVETEAYTQDDPAAHAWGIVDIATGLVKPSGRGYALFAPPGMSYVYLCYGVHWLLNVVTEREGLAGCVLIRALEPVAGLNRMFEHRPTAIRESDLMNGPGKLTQAMGIDGRHHGVDLCSGPIYFASDEKRKPKILTSSRVGITRAIDRPWRYFASDNRFVSPGIPSDVAAARRRFTQRSPRPILPSRES
jgi:DNA-3-methyladenine glycosylase